MASARVSASNLDMMAQGKTIRFETNALLYLADSSEPEQRFGNLEKSIVQLGIDHHPMEPCIYAKIMCQKQIPAKRPRGFYRKYDEYTIQINASNFISVEVEKSGLGISTKILNYKHLADLRERRIQGATIAKVTVQRISDHHQGIGLKTPAKEKYEITRQIGALLPQTQILVFYVIESRITERISQIAKEIERRQKSDPWAAFWNERYANSKIVQIGAQAALEKQPTFYQDAIPALINFPTFEAWYASVWHGLVREHELNQAALHKFEKGKYDVRPILDPWSNGTRIFLALNLGVDGRLIPETVARLRFFWEPKRNKNGKIIGEERHVNPKRQYWSKVVEPLPGVGFSDTTLIMDLAYQDKSESYAQDCPFSVMLNPKEVTAKNFAQAISDIEPYKVQLTIETSDIPFRRSTNAIRNLQMKFRSPKEIDPDLEVSEEERRVQFTQKMTEFEIVSEKVQELLGNDFDSLKKRDLYETVEDQEGLTKWLNIGILQYLNKDQVSILQMFRQMLGRFSFVQGPPGTGKTMLAILSMLGFLKFKKTRAKVTIATPNNQLATSVASRVQFVVDNDCNTPIMVTRVLPLGADEEIVRKHNPALRPNDPQFKRRTPSLEDQIKWELARTFMEAEAAITDTTYPQIKDKRVKDIELTVGWRMMQMAGVIQPGNGWESRNLDQWQDFRSYYTQWASGAEMSPDANNAFNNCIRDLRKLVIQRSDVVCCTVSTLGEAAVYENLSPDFLIIDEASRLREDESIIPISWYHCPILFIGDHLQTKPLHSTTRKNVFQDQCGMSLFERMIRAGYPSYMLKTQYRMHSDIGDTVSNLMYDGELEHDAKVVHQPGVKEGRSFLKKEFDIDSSTVFVNITAGNQDLSATMSKSNTANCCYVLGLIMRMIESDIAPEDIAVILPYNAQAQQYRSQVAVLQKRFPRLRLNKVHFEKTDSIMGREFMHAILDIPNTVNMGFMSEYGRLNVAISRAKASFIFVANRDALHGKFGAEKFNACFNRYWVEDWVKNVVDPPPRLDDMLRSLPASIHGKHAKQPEAPAEPVPLAHLKLNSDNAQTEDQSEPWPGPPGTPFKSDHEGTTAEWGATTNHQPGGAASDHQPGEAAPDPRSQPISSVLDPSYVEAFKPDEKHGEYNPFTETVHYESPDPPPPRGGQINVKLPGRYNQSFRKR